MHNCKLFLELRSTNTKPNNLVQNSFKIKYEGVGYSQIQAISANSPKGSPMAQSKIGAFSNMVQCRPERW